jgi:hypothetical protein
MAGKIFINYRRGDDPGNTGRLFDRLQDVFEPQQLFLDVDNIAPGLDFVRVLNERVGECDILLAVIGRSWIDTRDGAGKRRLEDPDDFVRIEIESALTQGKRVIPVLVGDAVMPRPDELPQTLQPLARRNAVRLTHERFRADTQGLIKALQNALTEIEEQQQARARTEAERRAKEARRLWEEETAQRADEERRLAEAEAARIAEEERRRQEAEVEARQRAAEERRRIEDAEKARQAEEAARAAEERRRIEEAAAARRAEEKARAAEERTRLEAENRRRVEEGGAFSTAKRSNTLASVEAFLAAYPEGDSAAEAKALKAVLLARAEAYRYASASEDAAVLRSFLQTYRRGADADEIRGRLQRLKPKRSAPLFGPAILGALAVAIVAATIVFWARGKPQPPSPSGEAQAPALQASVTPAAAPQTNSPNPTSNPAPAAVATEQIAWDLVKDSQDPGQLRRFIDQFPNGVHRSEAEQLISVLSSAPQPSATAVPNPRELARSLQFELKRVGCFNGVVDGEFDDPTKSAWQQFIKLTSLNVADVPSSGAVNAVRGFNNRVCPLVCVKGQHVESDSCVVNAPPPSRPSQRPQRGNGETVVDLRGQPPGTITKGGVTTCGSNGCQHVPKNCHAVTLGKDNPEWKGLGGKIICP